MYNRENYRTIFLGVFASVFINKYLQTQFNITSSRSCITTNLTLSQEFKVCSSYVSINVIQLINRLKDKNYMISINAEKIYKFQYNTTIIIIKILE